MSVKRFSAPLIAILFLSACGENLPPPTPATLDNLEIEYLRGGIGANLMPDIPPDPISCQVELLLTNRNPEESLTGLTIASGEVVLDSTHELLGEISFSTDWDGTLEPDEQDTVALVKDFLDESPFEPPCGEFVFLELRVENEEYEPKFFTTDTLFFTCLY